MACSQCTFQFRMHVSNPQLANENAPRGENAGSKDAPKIEIHFDFIID